MAVFQTSRRNVPLDMVNFWALKVLVFKFLGSNMVLRIEENGFKPKTAFLNFDFCTWRYISCDASVNAPIELRFHDFVPFNICYVLLKLFFKKIF